MFKTDLNYLEDIQEAYQDMASVLSEADGIDYNDPEEVKKKRIEVQNFKLLGLTVYTNSSLISLHIYSLNCWLQH